MENLQTRGLFRQPRKHLKKCELPGIRADYVDWYVWNTIIDMITDPTIIDEAIQLVQSKKSINKYKARLKELHREYDKDKRQSDYLLSKAMKHYWDDIQLQKHVEPVNRRMEHTKKEIKNVEAIIQKQTSTKDNYKQFRSKWKDPIDDTKHWDLEATLSNLSGKKKKAIVQYLYDNDIQIKLYSFPKNDLGRKITKDGVEYCYPNEWGGDTGIFIGKGQSIGASISTNELFTIMEGDKILNVLNSINKNSTMDVIGGFDC